METVRTPTLALLFTCVVAVPTASAVPLVYVVEPESMTLSWGWVPYGPDPTLTQRIRIRNDGTAATIFEVSTGAGFEIVDSGGDLGAGGEVYYDVRCALEFSDGAGEFRLTWCANLCEDEGTQVVWMDCSSILATSYNTFLPELYQDESAEIAVPFTNQRPEPVTVDAVAAEAPFAAALDGGPLTLAEGESGQVWVTFQPSGPGQEIGPVDILSGSDIVGRTRANGSTRTQIEPAVAGLFSIPLGATYARPVTIRNSSDLTRTITEVASDTAGVELSDLVGRTMAPREVIDAVATVQAGALGEIDATVTVAFDVAQGDAMRVLATVVPADFALEVDDATPTDGLLELGTVPVDAGASDRTVTLRNPGAEALAIVACPLASAGFSIVGDCPSSIPAGGSIDVAVRFEPAAATAQATERGDVQGTLAFQLASFPSARMLVHVRLVEPGAPIVSGDDQLDLGAVSVGAAAGGTVVLQNLGLLGFVVDRMEVVGEGFSGTEPGSFRVQRGGSLSIDVAFAPVEEGIASGSLLLYASGAAEPAVTVALTGEGVVGDPGDDGGDQPDDGDGAGDGDAGDGDAGDGNGGDGDGGDGDPSDDGDAGGDGAGGDSSGCAVHRGAGGFGDLLWAAGIALLAARRRRPRYSPRSSPLQ